MNCSRWNSKVRLWRFVCLLFAFPNSLIGNLSRSANKCTASSMLLVSHSERSESKWTNECALLCTALICSFWPRVTGPRWGCIPIVGKLDGKRISLQFLAFFILKNSNTHWLRKTWYNTIISKNLPIFTGFPLTRTFRISCCAVVILGNTGDSAPWPYSGESPLTNILYNENLMCQFVHNFLVHFSTTPIPRFRIPSRTTEIITGR